MFDKRVAILLNFAAIILFVASGAVIIEQWVPSYSRAEDRNYLFIAGSIAIVNGAVFLIDIFCILKYH